jgi:hypothetical protein
MLLWVGLDERGAAHLASPGMLEGRDGPSRNTAPHEPEVAFLRVSSASPFTTAARPWSVAVRRMQCNRAIFYAESWRSRLESGKDVMPRIRMRLAVTSEKYKEGRERGRTLVWGFDSERTRIQPGGQRKAPCFKAAQAAKTPRQGRTWCRGFDSRHQLPSARKPAPPAACRPAALPAIGCSPKIRPGRRPFDVCAPTGMDDAKRHGKRTRWVLKPQLRGDVGKCRASPPAEPPSRVDYRSAVWLTPGLMG